MLRFFGKFGMPCFLVTSVSRFAVLLYYRRIEETMIWVLMQENV